MTKTERRGHGQMERAKRLSDLLKAREITRYLFHKEMVKRGVPGSSYPNITRYLNGELNPTPDLFIAAADYLDVPITFLLEGKTERPVPKASVKLIAEQIEHDIARGFPGYELLAPSARWAPWQARQNIRAHKLMIGEEFEPRKLSRDFGKAINAPLKALGVDPSQLTRFQLENYVSAVCTALQFLTRDSR